MPKRKSHNQDRKRESGLPGGGAGRKDKVGGSGVYRMSGPLPAGDAPIVTPASWGQGDRGAAGYEDHGESEWNVPVVTPEKCRDLMTKDPVCCLPAETASRAAQLMRQHDVGVIPVVTDEAQKKLVGIVTDRDLAIRVVAEGGNPQTVRIEEIMSRDIVSCSPDDDCQQALRLMEEHKVRRIPARDNSGRVVGIISQSDVALRIRDCQKTADIVTAISQPG